MIACDTNPPSKQARKLKTCFSARLYYPRHSLRLEEKSNLARGTRVKNAHERDALASARKAFHAIAENKLRTVKRKLKKLKRSNEQRRVSAEVLGGKRFSDVVSR